MAAKMSYSFLCLKTRSSDDVRTCYASRRSIICDRLLSGDEILAVNGSILHGLSHDEAIAIFKSIRSGPVVLQVGRRTVAAIPTHHHFRLQGASKPPVPPPTSVNMATAKNDAG